MSAKTEVTVAAFKTLEVSNHMEQFIIEALRTAHALKASLVAEVDGRIVGHIAFSPVTISDGTRNWYDLGPVSVLPAYPRQALVKLLYRKGYRLKDMNAHGCCLVGHPDYYRKFGFKNMSGLVLVGVPQEDSFFALAIIVHASQGTVTFHEGFKADGQQKGAGDALHRA